MEVVLAASSSQVFSRHVDRRPDSRFAFAASAIHLAARRGGKTQSKRAARLRFNSPRGLLGVGAEVLLKKPGPKKVPLGR
jgi:hypothetical protein